MLIITVLSVLLSSAKQIQSAKCPSSEILKPCKCSDNMVIICDGDVSYSLKLIFDNLSNNLNNNSDRSFNGFVLNNTAITELEDNVFSNITFKSITIKDALSLTKIASNAFSGNTFTVEEFILQGESQIGEDKYVNELFDALSSLVNAKKIWLNKNRLKVISSVGFGKIPGFNRQLEDLNFNKFGSNNGYIKTIGNYAFYYSNNLKYLYLSHQRIDYIPANAFDFEKRSNQTLYIYLGNNRLNNTSFERGIFLNSKRPIHLELYWNHQLTHLDETIFAPFLKVNKRNKIRLIDNPLSCDCKSYWIIRDSLKFKGQIVNAKCKVGPNKVFNIELIPFDKCKSNRLRISVVE